jgi:hypothetical protein
MCYDKKKYREEKALFKALCVKVFLRTPSGWKFLNVLTQKTTHFWLRSARKFLCADADLKITLKKLFQSSFSRDE